MMEYDAVVIGGGIAGLTAAAYLSRAGKSILLCEQEEKCGGLVNTFVRDGFFFDGGIRAFENAGVLFPMLRQLGINIDLVPNRISLGIEDKIIFINSEESVEQYENLLKDLYPENLDEICQIFEQIRLMMRYIDIQYGIDNPMFLDFKKDQEYMVKKVIPWMFKYLFTAPKISRLNTPVLDFLKKYSQNQSLLDIIAQHFFRETPAFFALSYLKLYLDYYYPLGGTGVIISNLVDFITLNNGKIKTKTKITGLDINKRSIVDYEGTTYHYRKLIWAADQQMLYKLIDPDQVADVKTKKNIVDHKTLIFGKSGNDSVYTLFLGVNLTPNYFSSKCTGHFFYTPDRKGQSIAGPIPFNQNQQIIEEWLEIFFKQTTYEISIPVIRDSSLAPPGKTGLIISVLFDYQLTKYIENQGWYESFKNFCENRIVKSLDSSIFSGLEKSILYKSSSTPLTMARLTGNHEGAITGWSFTNHPVPAESRIPKILNAIKTPIPNVYQAGQWTYSPSGLPISFLTGKIAADQVIKNSR